jgi:hypothetical protein
MGRRERKATIRPLPRGMERVTKYSPVFASRAGEDQRAPSGLCAEAGRAEAKKG